MPLKNEVLSKLQEIEDELKRIGLWQSESLENEKFENMGPFGINTMSPEQWIQFVLLARVRDIANTTCAFPSTSQVAVWASRNFDGDSKVDRLCTLLAEFDRLFS